MHYVDFDGMKEVFARKLMQEDLIDIKSHAGELLVDSRDVAKLFEIQHKNLIELINKNKEYLTKLGQLAFQTEVVKGHQGGGNPKKFAFLTFDHVIFLLTMVRSTERTKRFKLQMILAFKNARERLRPIDTMLLLIPDLWEKTFPDDFYIALLNIYGGDFYRNQNKPSWVGAWTNKFIYEPIYNGLSSELKEKRHEYTKSSGKDSYWMKLHQFLEENARESLRDTISKVTALLQISNGKQEFAENYSALYSGAVQMRIEDLLKEPDVNPEYF